MSSPAAENSLRPPEHHPDEEGEREHVAPLEVEEEPAHRDELREHESRDEAARHAAQAAHHADEKGDRPERQADRRVHVVLQHQQAGAEAITKMRAGLTPISGMMARSWLMARIAVPR